MRPSRKALRLAAGLLLASLPCGLVAQSPDTERGRPLLRVHTMREFRGHSQLTSPSETTDGSLWFGNQLAVLRWDGARWESFPTSLTFTRATCLAPDGSLFVAGDDAFGRIAGGASPKFEDLAATLPSDLRPLGTVRQLLAVGTRILGVTDTALLELHPRPAVVAKFPVAARTHALALGNTVWIARAGEGVYRLGETAPVLEASLPVNAPAGARLLLAQPSGGASTPPLTYIGGLGFARVPLGPTAAAAAPRLETLPASADFVPPATPTSLLRLADGTLALGSADSGVFLMGPNLDLRLRLNRRSGLPADSIVALHEDRDRGLWVTTNNGPARLQLDAPVTLYDNALGLPDGRARSFARHEGKLHVLTTDGLFRLEPATPGTGEPARLVADARVGPQSRLSGILSHPAGLLFAGAVGMQRLTASGIEDLVSAPDGSWFVKASRREPARVFVGLGDGVRTGRFLADGTWLDEGNIGGVRADCCALHEEADGSLWIGTADTGVFRVRAGEGPRPWEKPEVRHFTTDAGLPEGAGLVFLYPTPAGLVFSTAKGLYRFEPATERFVASEAWALAGRTDLILDPMVPGASGELWTNGIAQTHDAPFPLARLRFGEDGTFKLQEAPPAVRALLEPFGANPVLWEPSATGAPEVVWAKGEGPLLRIELAAYDTPRTASAPRLRALASGTGTSALPPGGGGEVRALPADGAAVVRFSPGSFAGSESWEYQHRLGGNDTAWSPWSREPQAVLSTLAPGRHRLEVRARAAGAEPGPAVALELEVPQPWHRTAYAYFGYATAALALALALATVRTRALRREQVRLEALVASRTAELREARDAAENASRAKSSFLASMSHELRTPLNAILGYAQILLRERDRSRRDRERLEVVNASGEHLLRMINEVLDLSKIEAGRMELRPRPFHLGQLVRDIASAHEVRAREKGLAFRVEGPEPPPDFVLGDPQKLRQVLDNLLGNAVKFTREGSVVLRYGAAATTEAEGHLWTFAVRDTGVGIAATELERIFEPFTQAEHGRHSTEASTGLGLPIARRLVELQGGALTVASEVGRGSTFTCTLRLDVVASDSRSPLVAAGPAPVVVGYRGPRRSVLVVDDTPTNRDVLREMLEPLGFDITLAADGTEALAQVSARVFDAVLMDLRMPGMDGLECVRRLRALSTASQRPTPALIALSASVLGFTREDALRAGCDDFLGKPFPLDALLSILQRLLKLDWLTESQQPAPSVEQPGPDAPASIQTVQSSTHLQSLREAARLGDIAAIREHLQAARHAGALPSADLDLLEQHLAAFRITALREQLARK